MFGALYSTLDILALHGEPHGRFAMGALNDFVAARPTIPTRSLEVRRRRASANLPDGCVTLAAASRMLNTTSRMLRAYVDRHDLIVSGGGGKGEPLLLRTADIEALRHAIASSANRKQSYRILGVPKKVFRELLRAGIVPPPSGGPLTELRGLEAWRVADLEALVCRLEQHVLGGKLLAKDAVTVGQAARSGSNLGLGTADVLRAVMSGQLIPAGLDTKARGIRRLRFRMFDVRTWVERVARERVPTLCVNDAARLLRAKPEVCYQWVNNGLLPTISVPGDRAQMGRRVREEDIAAFRQRYVTATWLRDEGYGLGRALAERIIRLGVKPVSGPSVDGLRLYLFPRADVETIAHKLPRNPRRSRQAAGAATKGGLGDQAE
jgi:hypothetical protein